MRDREAEVEAAGLTVLGASFDDAAANRAFAEKYDFPYKLLCDTDRSLGLAYGAADTADQRNARRVSYVIDEAGKILLVYPKVNPSDHLDQILADLRRAG